MNNLYLIEPAKEYQKSFEDYALAYKRHNDEFYYNFYKKALEDFGEYLMDLWNYSQGINIPLGWVPGSTFWLIHNDEVVGVVRVRHQEAGSSGHIGYDISPDHRNKGYGTVILKLALEKAAQLGIKEAIITCNTENEASKKIIQKHNGKLLGTIYDEEDHEYLYKYSVSTNGFQL